MAYLGQAGALLQAGKKDEALAVYQKAATDTALPALWRDLSVLQAARLQWGMEDGKPEGSAAALLAGLEPLIKNPRSPWHFHARLQAALIAADGQGDYLLAHTHLAAIQRGENIPPMLMQRAKALDHIYMIRAAEAKQEKAGE